MGIRLYNTLTRRKEEFEPLSPPRVGMYACGPTVYNFAHIGNLRTFLFEDLLKRHLRYRGYQVLHVMNLTDVEDKIIRTCRETGESLRSLTQRYTEAFFEDLRTLGVILPDVCPRATEHVPEMVELIKRLEARGHTYRAPDGVYYKIDTFDGYGKLSHFDLEALKQGASGRVQADEYSAEEARDFALWKAWDEDDGDIFWETEVGKGRPGWHLECSAMSMKYLGESFDIHCGAVDLIFPHHENEIAQSEGATGKPFVKYWLHAAHLNLEGRKISKSLGNVVTLRDLLEQGHDPMAIRWALRATHYRQPTNFSLETLESARQSVHRVRDFLRRLAEVRKPQGDDLADAARACETAFAEALDDDLNISAALASVFEFIRDVNKRIDEGTLSVRGAETATTLLNRLDAVAGLFEAPKDQTPTWVLDKVAERQRARRSKEFGRADAIRDELLEAGWAVEDTPDGPRVKRT